MKKSFKIILITAVSLLVLTVAIVACIMLIDNEKLITVTFVTDGSSVEAITLKKGEKLEKEPITSKSGSVFLGWYTDSEGKEAFYNEVPLTEDTVLYAGFTETGNDIRSYESKDAYKKDCAPNMPLNVISEIPLTAENLGDNITVDVLMGELPDFSVEKIGNVYSITPKVGYTEGGVYRFILNKSSAYYEGYNESVKELTISIHKDESEILELRDDKIKYIKRGDMCNVVSDNEFCLPSEIVNAKALKNEDTLCLGNGTDMLEDGTKFVNILGIYDDGTLCHIFTEGSAIDDVIADMDVYFEGVQPDIAFINEARFDEVEKKLYNSQGTRAIATYLAAMLSVSPTVEKLINESNETNNDSNETTNESNETNNDSNKSDKVNSKYPHMSDNAEITTVLDRYSIDGLIEGLTISVESGLAENNNLKEIKLAKWSGNTIKFSFDTVLKNKIKLRASVEVRLYSNIAIGGLFKKKDSDITFNAVAEIITQTDFLFTIMVCSADTSEDDYIDITKEIEKVIGGDKETENNLIMQLQDMLENDGDYIELLNIEVFEANIPVVDKCPVVSINAGAEFVLKFNFAAGISTKMTIINGMQVGLIGNSGDKSLKPYYNSFGLDRYDFDMYACGYLGLKAGLSVKLTISLYKLDDYGEFGMEFELGAYADLYGYTHFRMMKLPDTYIFMEGGLYLEIGMYIEVNAIARSKFFKATAEFNIAEKKIPILGIGSKYVLIELETDTKQNTYIMHADSVNLNYLPFVYGTFLDITTGETMKINLLLNSGSGISSEEDGNPLIDTSFGILDKHFVKFSSPYFTVDANNLLSINKDKFGNYNDGVQKGDQSLVTYMTTIYIGQTMSLGIVKSENDTKWLSRVGNLKIIWVDPDLSLENLELGKEVKITFYSDCNGVKTKLAERLAIVGSLGGRYDYSELAKKYQILGWDKDPSTMVVTEDMSFTLKIKPLQVLVSFVYFNGTNWVIDYQAVDLLETPVVPEGAENDYDGKMTFKGWKGYRSAHANDKAIDGTFDSVIQIPLDIYSSPKDMSKDLQTGITLDSSVLNYDMAQSLTYLSTKNYDTACYYVADYNFAECNVTFMCLDINREVYTPTTIKLPFGSYIYQRASTSHYLPQYEALGWDYTGDLVMDCDMNGELPRVYNGLTITSIYKRNTAKLHLINADGKETIEELLAYEIIKAEYPAKISGKPSDGGDYTFSHYEYSYDNLTWRKYNEADNVRIFGDTYLRPVFTRYYTVTVNSGDGIFADGKTSFSLRLKEGTTLSSGAYMNITANRTGDNKTFYTHNGWIDGDNVLYPMTFEKTVTKDMTFSAVLTPSDRLYTLIVSCDEGGFIFGTNAKTLTLNNLNYNDYIEKREYYKVNLPTDNLGTEGYIISFINGTVTNETVLGCEIIYTKVVTPKEYTVTYNCGDGLFADGSKEIKYTVKYNDEINTSNVASVYYSTDECDYTLAGWKTEDGTEFAIGEKIVCKGDLKLSAIYIKGETKSYKIRFTTEYGVFANGQKALEWTGKYNETIPVSENIIENEVYAGYTVSFKGWDKPIPEKITEDIEISALWEKVYITYYIRYYLNGTLYRTEDHFINDTLIEFTLPESETAGNKFSGWKWKCEAGAYDNMPVNMPGNDITVDGTVTKYYVYYMIDGTITESFYAPIGNSISIKALPEKVGYTYSAWAANDGTDISGGSFIMPDRNVTISTQSVINKHTVTYMVDGEQYGDVLTFDYGTSVTVTAKPSKAGFTFTGWKINGDLIAVESFTLQDSDITIIGSFERNKYNVNYFVDGVLLYTDEIPFEDTVILRGSESAEGMVFSGWTTTDVTLTEGQFSMPDKDVNFNAYFSAGEYSVTYRIEGNPDIVVNEDYNETVNLVPAPNKEGHTFSSWQCADIIITDGSFVMPAKSIIIVGTYTVNTYSVQYKDKENGSILKEENVEYGSSASVCTDEFVRRGLVSGSMTPTSPLNYSEDKSTFIMPAHNVVFVAEWKDALTVDDGVHFDKYDTDNKTFDGYDYDEARNILKITVPGLTVSGKADDVQIYIDTSLVTLDNLTIVSNKAGYYYSIANGEAGLPEDNAVIGTFEGFGGYKDGAIIYNMERDTEIRISGKLSFSFDWEKLESDNKGVISGILFTDDNGYQIASTLTLKGMGENATFETVRAIFGVDTQSLISIENLSINMETESFGLCGGAFDIDSSNICIKTLITDYSFAIMTYTGSSDAFVEHIVINDSTLKLDGKIYTTGNLTFKGNTSGYISDNNGSSVYVNGNITADIGRGCSLSIGSVHNTSGSYPMYSYDGEIILTNGNVLASPAGCIIADNADGYSVVVVQIDGEPDSIPQVIVITNPEQ